MTTIFTDKLLAYHASEGFLTEYKACVERIKGQLYFRVYQPIGDEYHHVGTRHLETVRENLNDKLYIDYGQGWYVEGLIEFFEAYDNFKQEDRHD